MATVLRGSDNLDSAKVLSEELAGSIVVDSAGRVTMPYQPAVFATTYGSGGASSVTGQIYYGNIKNNIGNHFNGRVFTAPIAGSYMVVATVLNRRSGANTIRLRHNGVAASAQVYMNAYDETATASACIYLNVNDTVDAYTSYEHYENDYGDFSCFLVG